MTNKHGKKTARIMGLKTIKNEVSQKLERTSKKILILRENQSPTGLLVLQFAQNVHIVASSPVPDNHTE